MLEFFFKLNVPSDPDVEIREFWTIEELREYFTTSSMLENALFKPESISRVENDLFKKRKFKNVSFSKTKFENLTIRNCRFEDCLFIGSEFIRCEFHQCEFVNCNTHKISISNCYIDPDSFSFSNCYKTTHSNIGTHLFHELFMNSQNTHQPIFAGESEISFRRWLRSQHKHQFKLECRNNRGFLGVLSAGAKHFFYLTMDYLNDCVIGYGYRPARLVGFSLIALMALAAGIHWSWSLWGLSNGADLLPRGDFSTSAYYATVVVTTLGFGDITPTTTAGRLMAMGMAIGGVVWLSLLAAVLIKRLIR